MCDAYRAICKTKFLYRSMEPATLATICISETKVIRGTRLDAHGVANEGERV